MGVQMVCEERGGIMFFGDSDELFLMCTRCRTVKHNTQIHNIGDEQVCDRCLDEEEQERLDAPIQER